ncbi:MAG: hypothetical protein KDC18_16775, partial [Alphaproteobacteria bacterium]|nr:hypothetical protein [Alphaproteobacteria bacterium]
MSYVADAARDTLKASGVALRQARRTLYLAAGVLALLHLLTVAPYIAASKTLADIEAAMAANRALLAAVDPGVASLAEAGKRAQRRLEETLREATDDMIGRFNALRPLIAEAQQGRV